MWTDCNIITEEFLKRTDNYTSSRKFRIPADLINNEVGRLKNVAMAVYFSDRDISIAGPQRLTYWFTSSTYLNLSYNLLIIRFC